MKKKTNLFSSHLLLLAVSTAALMQFTMPVASATTYTWQNSNVNASTRDWFSGGSNTQATWSSSPGAQGSSTITNADTVQFFQDTTTPLGNTTAFSQTANVNNGGTAVQLGILTLSGFTTNASSGKNYTLTASGDALNFSAATGTVNLDAKFTNSTLTYNVNNAIQLGTAGSANALTITGTGTGVFNFGGIISELQTGGGSLVKSGTSTVSLTNANSYTGTTTISAGTLQIGGGSTTGSLSTSSTISLSGGFLAFNRSNAVVQGTDFSGAAITGAGGFIQAGSSTLTLNATNSFSGEVQARSGTLSVSTISDKANAQPLGRGTFIQVGNSSGVTGILEFTGSTNSTTDKQIRVGASNASGQQGSGSILNNGTGSLTFSNSSFNVTTGGQTAVRTLTLGGSYSGGINEIQGAIINGAGSGNALTVSGSTWKLSGTNTYTGTTTVSGGTLQFAKMASLYNNTPASWTPANINVKSGATLALNVDSAGTAGFDSGNLNTLLTSIYGGTSTSQGLQAGASIGIDTSTATSGTFTQGNAITNSTGTGGGALGLTKLGTGTLVLDKTNTYTGATTVSAGVLAVNGSLANTSTTIGNTGTLRGSGSIGGSVTVQNGGTIAAGNSIESLATGALTLNGGSTIAYELDNDAAASAAGDLTAVSGNLTLDLSTAAILTLAELGSGSWTPGEKLTLISYSGTWNGGLFKYNGSSLADDSTLSFNGQQWLFNYNATTAGTNFTGDLVGSSFVTMTAVPEPRTALLGGLGLFMLFKRRRS